MSKPEAIPHVYDWQAVKAWLRAEAPAVASDVERMVKEWECGNGSLQHVALSDWKRGWCGDALSAESIAWLEANLAPVFWLHVWW